MYCTLPTSVHGVKKVLIHDLNIQLKPNNNMNFTKLHKCYIKSFAEDMQGVNSFLISKRLEKQNSRGQTSTELTVVEANLICIKVWHQRRLVF